MAWRKPKTDWTGSDYFNLSDYTRIRENIIVVKDKADATFGTVTIESMDAKNSETDCFYARNMNAFENNVEALNEGTYNFDIGDTVEYSPNGATPTYTEFNRIEGACWRLYQAISAQESIAEHIAFTLNGIKPLGNRVHYAKNETISYRFEYRLGSRKGGFK